MGIEYKKINSNDLKEVVSLFKSYRTDWEPIYNLDKIIELYPAVAVYNNNKLIGFAYCYYFAPDILELANIFVTEKFRDLNVGSTLLKKIEEEVRVTKFKGIILTNSIAYKSVKDKKPANNFYLKNNYQLITQTEVTTIFYKEIK